MEPRLRMQGVHKRFGATTALAGVDLGVPAGEVHALIGENGAGKSTLMKVLAGALRPDAGQMWLDGQAYEPRTPAAGRRAGVAMIYQELALAPHLSVADNIVLGIEPARGPLLQLGEARRLAAAALAELGRSDLPLDSPAARLSVAQRQLVEIARALAAGCRVLVLDEPTSTLPADDVERLFALIRRLSGRGHAIVYISHALEEVKTIAHRFTVLRDGRVAGCGDVAATSVNDIVAMMVGRPVEDLYARSPRTPGEVVLEIDDLAAAPPLASASLRLRRGEVLGVAGLIGAGRSELARAIFGLDPVVRGRIRVGVASGPRSPWVRWAEGVGMVSEDRALEGLALGMSVADNLTLPRLRDLGPAGLITNRGQDRAARPWLERLRVTCQSSRQRTAELSGGNQQKVALARLLHARVDVLILDEPTRGIDVGARAEVYRLVDDLASGRGDWHAPRAILMISSSLPELLGTCDRIAVMRRGRLGPARPVGELDEHRLMLEATGAAA